MFLCKHALHFLNKRATLRDRVAAKVFEFPHLMMTHNRLKRMSLEISESVNYRMVRSIRRLPYDRITFSLNKRRPLRYVFFLPTIFNGLFL